MIQVRHVGEACVCNEWPWWYLGVYVYYMFFIATFIQHVNLKIFENILLKQCHEKCKCTSQEAPPLTDDEASALRYAAGYVPFALKKKLKSKLAITI